MLVPTLMSKQQATYKVPSWNEGTDFEIMRALEKHYAGEIDITEYWSVGDERTVHLSTMSNQGYVSENHVEQDVTFVLMHTGGKELVEPINGHTECAFIVGQKNCLANGATIETGYMNSSASTAGGWNDSKRRSWCNNVYYNANPLQQIFKQFKNITSKGSSGQSIKITSNDYFALPSEKEIWGTTQYSDSTAEEDNIQFEYYSISLNRIKGVEINKSVYSQYWLRSPSKYGSEYFCKVGYSVSGNSYTAVWDSSEADYADGIGIAPFGVI